MRIVAALLLLVACGEPLPTDYGLIEQPWFGETLYLRPGFRIGEFAQVDGGIRNIAVGPGGDVYAGAITTGQILRIRDIDGNGMADSVVTVLSGLLRPFGLAFRGDTLYYAEEHRISRLDPGSPTPVVVVQGVPATGGHSSRSIAFGPDGKLYLSVGSSCNVCVETDSFRAAILQFEADGSMGRVFASGLRNSVGLAFHPLTGELWATNNDRDDFGGSNQALTDNLPPERINIVRAGRWYGWPQCYLPQLSNPEFPTADCSGVEPPRIAFQAHSAPLGVAFYTGAMFPAEYQGETFVALHGSWNRTIPTGAAVMRVRMQPGHNYSIEGFVLGWQRPDGTRWGRPVAIAQLPDGSLLISDDLGRRIWRVTYEP